MCNNFLDVYMNKLIKSQEKKKKWCIFSLLRGVFSLIYLGISQIYHLPSEVIIALHPHLHVWDEALPSQDPACWCNSHCSRGSRSPYRSQCCHSLLIVTTAQGKGVPLGNSFTCSTAIHSHKYPPMTIACYFSSSYPVSGSSWLIIPRKCFALM